MSAALAFVGTFLLSLFVALLAALQLADYFGSNEEFILVLMVLPVFVTVAMLAFVIANAAARRAGVLTAIAILFAFIALAPLALPRLVQANRSTNPFAIGIENAAVAIELVVPALLAVLVQWGLVQRRWLRVRGEDELTRWPWVTTIVAGLAVLNPLGLDVLGQAIAYRPGNWMRDLFLTITMSGAGVLVAMGLIECYIRSRMLRRRTQSPAAVRIAAPG